MHAYTHRELLIPFCNYENITRTHDISRRAREGPREENFWGGSNEASCGATDHHKIPPAI